MPELITAGNACADIFVPLERLPPPGGIERIPSLAVEIGGNGANTAVVASRLGISTALAGVLGGGGFSHTLREGLAEEGVDLSLLEPLEDATAPATLVINAPDGERGFLHSPGSNDRFALPPRALEEPCQVFHLAAPELLGPFWPGPALEAAKELKRKGRVVSLDVFAVGEGEANRRRLVAEHRPLLELADIVLPNEDEARLITGESSIEGMLRYLHDAGVPLVAIKRGALGAVVSFEGTVEHVPTSRVVAVDTCGAGDNFAAGFLAGRIRGLDPVECARIGCMLGTLSVEQKGSLTATADRKRIAEIVRRIAAPAAPSRTLGDTGR